jgi:PST family polysaccharide transporter
MEEEANTGDGLRDRAVRGVAWSALRNWGSRIVTLAVWIVLARILSQEAFGLIAAATAYVALVNVFVEQGFVSAIIQREEVEDGHLDTAFWTSVALGVVLAGASVVAAPFVARFFDQPQLGPIIAWMAPALVLAALAGMPQALFERALDYRLLAIREFIAVAVGGVVGVAMAVQGYGVWSLVGWQLSERTASVAVLWAATTWRPGVAVTARHFRDLFSFGINIVGTNLLDYLNNRSDDLIILYVLGPTALGFYEIAYRLFTNGTQLVAQSVSSVAFSTFSRIQGDVARLRRAFYTTTQVASVVAFPLFLGAAALAPQLVELLFGAKWLPQSAQVFQVLAALGVLHAVFYFNGPVMLAMGKPHWRLGLNTLNAVANVAVVLAVVQWGIVAVAAAYTVRGYVLAPLQVWVVRRLLRFRVREYMRRLLPALLCSLAMAGIVAGAVYLAAGRVGIVGVVGGGVLLGAVVYVGLIRLVSTALFEKVRELLYLVLPTSRNS